MRVDVCTYVAQNKLSTQVAARTLRYEALHRMMKSIVHHLSQWAIMEMTKLKRC